MIGVEFVIVLLSILIGARLGSIAIGLSSGLGVLILTLILGIKPGIIPFDVIEIIMSVTIAIAVMQVAGGMDYLVKLAEHLLRKHPRHITFLAPLISYIMTLLSGTGHTIFSTLPIIAEVAKEHNIRPSRPLSIAVIASQIAITASPISAAVVFFASILEPYGINYLTLLCVSLPSTMISIFLAAMVTNFLGKDLKDDHVYQAQLLKGEISSRKTRKVYEVKPHAGLAVLLFLIGIFSVMLYCTFTSENIELISNPILSRNEAITVFMFTVATLICIFCKIDTSSIIDASTFKSGMSACVCIMGVAWLGDTFIQAHLNNLKLFASHILQSYPWMLALILFFASTLLYSQAATTKALMPAALTLGLSPITVVASFSAVSALFILPTYPTLLAAVEIDDTGSTKIGNYIFNHSFIIPGILSIIFSVIFGFLFANIIL
ncbi:anaerobic C4-dicarboxylate transporter [Pantoea sp. Mhis]|uniref:anaerobic C4-dicarboxylate transporter n=1 Tax=Pantoea sp. Mhis TaxID=2576759 RepID=UPI001359E368|nr:anaerobic C4-dicarboxylate transporter [Pantoea sp. Mhis]MXP56766.1 anaerobic C4-dicarboxylate transporter [Pantoea sp. Mhis]